MHLLPALLVCSTMAVPVAAQEGTAEQVPAGLELKDADHKKLARPFGEWFDAKLKGEFNDETGAKAKLIDECADFDKRLKTRSVLSMVRDWEKILDEGREYATSGATIKKGRTVDLDVGGGATFALRLPAEYNPKKQGYPGVLVLAAGKAADTLEALPAEWKEQFILIGVDLTGLDAELLAKSEGLVRMLGPIGVASRNYRLDRRRLYLIGSGALGASAASRAAAMYPMAFAGCAWVDGEPTAGLNAGNLKNLPAEAKADMTAALTWIAGLPPRNAYPLAFEAVLTEANWGRHYWVQALRYDPLEAVPTGKIARFRVQVDRATNTITLDSEFVYSYRIFLNDEIVDLDKEIVIVRNGEPYKFTAERTVVTLLDNFAQSLDAGMIFPASLQRLDVPIPETTTKTGSSTSEGR